ncbi:MAG: TrmH family RNA methyltransferase [Muribaculaceae bacterium]|nr:TrmH family RNA methyltransferase [Muribaculaceae bacterium]
MNHTEAERACASQEESHRPKKNILELTRCSVSAYRALEKLPVLLLADNVRSMHNVGAFLRTCDAFRMAGVVMAGITPVPPHPLISKTALGAEDSVAWHYVTDAVAEARRLKAEGWTLCALEQAHDSVRLDDFLPVQDRRYVLVVGNEVEGVNQEIVDIADTVLEIPQEGVKHSLNVSVSAGIALWHFYASLSR